MEEIKCKDTEQQITQQLSKQQPTKAVIAIQQKFNQEVASP